MTFDKWIFLMKLSNNIVLSKIIKYYTNDKTILRNCFLSISVITIIINVSCCNS